MRQHPSAAKGRKFLKILLINARFPALKVYGRYEHYGSSRSSIYFQDPPPCPPTDVPEYTSAAVLPPLKRVRISKNSYLTAAHLYWLKAHQCAAAHRLRSTAINQSAMRYSLYMPVAIISIALYGLFLAS